MLHQFSGAMVTKTRTTDPL